MPRKVRCGVILISQKGDLLIVHEKSLPISLRKIGFPKGGRKYINNKLERPLETAKRELKEEVGVDLNYVKHKILFTVRKCMILYCVRLLENVTIRICEREILKFEWVSFKNLSMRYRTNKHKYNMSIKQLLERYNYEDFQNRIM